MLRMRHPAGCRRKREGPAVRRFPAPVEREMAVDPGGWPPVLRPLPHIGAGAPSWHRRRGGARSRIVSARPNDRQGNCMDSIDDIGADRVLLVRGAAVPKVPGSAAHVAGRGVGEPDRKRHPAGGGVGSEADERRGVVAGRIRNGEGGVLRRGRIDSNPDR